MDKKIRIAGALALAAVWAVLTAFAWFSPPKKQSDTERRLLNQPPKVTGENILSGRFATAFEKYANDQFPGRDSFRSIKALTHRYGLAQLDNNDIYLTDGYLAKQEYPLNEESVSKALTRFEALYDSFLKESDCKVYSAVIPDKSYYLAQDSGHLTMDYEKLFSMVQTRMPFATYVDLTDTLDRESYYRTDTHWRQEAIVPVAQKLCTAMEMTAPETEDFTARATEKPFYGVYYGQAALPMPGETMYLMESDALRQCRVGVHNGMKYESLGYDGVYDLEKLSSKEPYDVFLSGPQSILQIENPNGQTDRELVIFRDSFGSSLAPLLVSRYKTVTLVDIRYIDSRLLGRFLDFHGQDVLFLYSTLVLNSGMIQ